MANRVLLGNHFTFGYGLFVSKPTADVTGATRSNFLFSSAFSDTNTGIVDVDGIGFNIVQAGTVARTANNTTSDLYANLRTINNIYFPIQVNSAGTTKPPIVFAQATEYNQTYREYGYNKDSSNALGGVGVEWQVNKDGFNASGGAGTTHGQLILITYDNRTVDYVITTMVEET